MLAIRECCRRHDLSRSTVLASDNVEMKHSATKNYKNQEEATRVDNVDILATWERGDVKSDIL